MSLFGLISSLDSSKWHESDSKPTKKKEIGGGSYESFAIMSDLQKEGYMEFVLAPNNGDTRKGNLYATCGNPLRGISTCWFAFGKGGIIKGMALDDDWVLMNDDYLSTLEAGIVETNEVPDLGLFYDLKQSKWTKKGEPPGGKAKLGYNDFDVSDVIETGPGEIQVSLQSYPPGIVTTVKMLDVERNCFRSTPYCFLKVVNGEVIGVMTKKDWIEKNK